MLQRLKPFVFCLWAPIPVADWPEWACPSACWRLGEPVEFGNEALDSLRGVRPLVQAVGELEPGVVVDQQQAVAIPAVARRLERAIQSMNTFVEAERRILTESPCAPVERIVAVGSTSSA